MNARNAAILALLIIVVACWWFLVPAREEAGNIAVPMTVERRSPPPLVAPPSIPLPAEAQDIVPPVQTRELPKPDGGDPIIPSIPLETGELPWEATIRGILSDEKASESEKGRRLLETIPTMPVDGRETAAEEAIKRIPNVEYLPAQTALANPAMFGTSLSVLYADLIDRPDEVRLPTLLMIARNNQHPYAPTARDNLNLVLGKNLGVDWTGWDAAIRQYLAAKSQ